MSNDWTPRELSYFLNEAFPDDAPQQGGNTMKKMRDVCGTMWAQSAPRGDIHRTGPDTTTIVTPDVPILAVGTYSLNVASQKFSLGGTTQLVYDDDIDRNAVVILTMDFTGDPAPTATAYVAKNGVVIPESAISVDLEGADPQAIATQILTPVTQGDYFEVWVALSAAGSLQTSNVNLLAFT